MLQRGVITSAPFHARSFARGFHAQACRADGARQAQRDHGGGREGQEAEGRRPRYCQLFHRRSQLPARRARLRRGARSAGKRFGTVRFQPRQRRAARCLSETSRRSRPDRLHAQEHRDRHRRQARAVQPGRSPAQSRRHHRLPGAVLDYLRRYRRYHRRECAPVAVPGRAELQAHPGPARCRAARCPGFPVQQPVQPDGHGVYEGRNRRAGRRAGQAPGRVDHLRRHLQPHGLRRRRLPQFRDVAARAARSRDPRRLAVQDLRHARLARRLHRRTRAGRPGDGHAQFQPHHQYPRDGHRRRRGRR